jgi:hypothetical protein
VVQLGTNETLKSSETAKANGLSRTARPIVSKRELPMKVIVAWRYESANCDEIAVEEGENRYLSSVCRLCSADLKKRFDCPNLAE